MEEEDKEVMEIIWKRMCVNVAWFIMSVLAGMLLLIIILILLMIMLDKWERERDKRKEAEATRRTLSKDERSKPSIQGK